MMVWVKKQTKDQSRKSVSNLSGRLAGRCPSPEAGQRYSGKGEALTDFCRVQVRKPLAHRQYHWWKPTSFKQPLLPRHDYCIFLSADMLVFKCPWGYFVLWDIAWIQREGVVPAFQLFTTPFTWPESYYIRKTKRTIYRRKTNYKKSKRGEASPFSSQWDRTYYFHKIGGSEKA